MAALPEETITTSDVACLAAGRPPGKGLVITPVYGPMGEIFRPASALVLAFVQRRLERHRPFQDGVLVENAQKTTLMHKITLFAPEWTI